VPSPSCTRAAGRRSKDWWRPGRLIWRRCGRGCAAQLSRPGAMSIFLRSGRSMVRRIDRCARFWSATVRCWLRCNCRKARRARASSSDCTRVCIDGALQATVGLHWAATAAPGRAYLPFAIEAVEVFAGGVPSLWAWIRRSAAGGLGRGGAETRSRFVRRYRPRLRPSAWFEFATGDRGSRPRATTLTCPCAGRVGCDWTIRELVYRAGVCARRTSGGRRANVAGSRLS